MYIKCKSSMICYSNMCIYIYCVCTIMCVHLFSDKQYSAGPSRENTVIQAWY